VRRVRGTGSYRGRGTGEGRSGPGISTWPGVKRADNVVSAAGGAGSAALARRAAFTSGAFKQGHGIGETGRIVYTDGTTHRFALGLRGGMVVRGRPFFAGAPSIAAARRTLNKRVSTSFAGQNRAGTVGTVYYASVPIRLGRRRCKYVVLPTLTPERPGGAQGSRSLHVFRHSVAA